MRLILFLILLVLGAPILGASPKPQVHKVVIKDIKFNPENLEISQGDTVQWTNEDIVPHTVTDKGVFDSKIILPDKSFKFTFQKKRTYPYACNFHPMMKASIIVK